MIPYLLALAGGYLLGKSIQSESFAKGGMVVTSIKDIPNFKERLDEGKITYRGLGLGKLYDRFYEMAGENGVRIKVDGKEYYITDSEFNTFSRDSQGKMRIRFDAPHRKFAEGGVAGKEYQIKKPDGTYFYLKMSTGNAGWAESADMGYQYTQEEAEKVKERLEKEGHSGLSVVKYEKDWWKNAKDEFADGGVMKQKWSAVFLNSQNYTKEWDRDNESKRVSVFAENKEEAIREAIKMMPKLFTKIRKDENGYGWFLYSIENLDDDKGVQFIDEFADGGSTDSIAMTILKQLGGAGRLNAMTGAYNFRDLGNGLAFKIKNQRANYIKITLNGMDLYDLEVGRTRGTTYKVVASHDNVYFDQLKPLIEKATGMYLSLFAKGGEIKWQDVEVGDSARVKDINKSGVIVKTYGRKFHLKFVDGTEKTYDATELEFTKN